MPLSAGSPPLPPSYNHLITGDSSEFTSSLGSWVATGGTMTRDTGWKYGSQTASLKHVTTAAGHRVDLAISGTFKAGAEYVVFFAVSREETGILASARHRFGLLGTDEVDTSAIPLTTPTYDTPSFTGSSNRWAVMGMRWKPTANRTGVSLRVERPNADSSNTQTWHIGWVKCFRIPVLDGPATVMEPGATTDLTRRTYSAPSSLLSTGSVHVGSAKGSGFYSGPYGHLGMDISEAGFDISHGQLYLWGESGIIGDLTGQHINIEVGDDYVGMNIAEKDSDTVQMYADSAGGYMMQLRNRGSGKGWAISDDGTINQKITDTFQWPFYVAGAQTTGTNKAAYFQVPEKCRIDEVRIHLGTAPTGSTFLVDVNDDGTTIFTTQGNRPEIAISGTDDTSGTPDGGTAVAKDSVLTIDVDQIGSTIAGSDLVVFVRGRYIW